MWFKFFRFHFAEIRFHFSYFTFHFAEIRFHILFYWNQISLFRFYISFCWNKISLFTFHFAEIRFHISFCWTQISEYCRFHILKTAKEKWQPHVSHAQIRFHFANNFILLKILRIIITKILHKTDSIFTYLDNLYICLHRLHYIYFQIHLMFRNYLWNYKLILHFSAKWHVVRPFCSCAPVHLAPGLASWDKKV